MFFCHLMYMYKLGVYDFNKDGLDHHMNNCYCIYFILFDTVTLIISLIANTYIESKVFMLETIFFCWNIGTVEKETKLETIHNCV